MATRVELELIAETKDAQKNVQDLTDKVKGLEEQNDDIIQQNKKVEKSSKAVGTSFRAIGTAFKAIGIGIVIALLAKLGDALSKNQKVVDFFSTGLEALSIAFSDLFDFLFDNVGTWISAVKEVFENPKKAIQELGDAIKANIIERFESALEVAGFLADGLKKLFAGDFKGALDSAKEAGKELADVFTGVDDTTTKISEGISNVVDAVTEYTKATLEQAAANVQLKNTAELAAAQQQRLVEQYDRQAEQQRQIRDEERNSIEDRIKANDELGKVLQNQEDAMLRLANLQIAAAQSQVDVNNNIENQVALTEALANKEAILAQVEGFRSEQLVNDLALKKELLELDNTITDAQRQRQIEQLEFEAGRETDPLKKLEKEREALIQESQIEQERLEAKIAQYKLGTQARVDAEIELKDKLQQIGNEITANEDEQVLKKAELEQKLADYKVETAFNVLNALASIAEEGSAGAKAIAVAQAVLSTYLGINKALAETTDFTPTQSLRFANAIAVGISGFANVAKILSTDSSGKGGASISGGGGGGGVSAPSFNVVGASGTNQLAQSLQQDDKPLQAFVVGSNVTSQQALDRNIKDTATIG